MENCKPDTLKNGLGMGLGFHASTKWPFSAARWPAEPGVDKTKPEYKFARN